LFCQTAVAGDIRSALIEIPNRAVAPRPGAAFVTIQGDEPRESLGRGRCLGKCVHAGAPDTHQVDLRGGNLTCARKPCCIDIGTDYRAGEGGNPSLAGLSSWSGAGLGIAAVGLDLALAGLAVPWTFKAPPCPR
jgi:hypothetical protein